MRPCSNFWIEKDGKVVLSEWRVALLEAVEQTGSINAAAAQQGVPFRVAWRKIQEEVAQRFRMTPIGFLRETQCNVYTHPERLRGYRRSRRDDRKSLTTAAT
jgi:hypothetical protein